MEEHVSTPNLLDAIRVVKENERIATESYANAAQQIKNPLGKQLFEQYCVVCHGQSGEGDGFNAYNLNPKPHSLSDSTYMRALSSETLTETISFGGKGINKSVLMPAYQNTLSKTQISNVVVYIETFTKTK